MSEAVMVEADVPESVVAIAFKVNGAPLAPDDVDPPYEVRWDTTTLPDGTHEVSATATDAQGKSSTRVHEVKVSNPVAAPPGDKTAPVVQLTSPSVGATLSGEVSVAAAASDDVGVVGVQFKLGSTNLGAEDTSAPYSVAWDTTKATNGQHTLSAVARDAAGNSSSASVTVSVSNQSSGDATKPTVSLTSPSAGATVAGQISVTASASDNVGVVGVQFKLGSTNLGAEDTSAPYSVAWDTTKATNGQHTLSAVARDAAGNSSSASVNVSVSNESTSDTTKPTVSVTNPTSGATVGGQVSVTAAASDDVGVAGVQFKLDGANLGAEDTSAPYAVTWDTTKATNAQHTLSAVARDAAGNVSSASVNVTVSNGSTGDPWSPSGSALRWAAPGYDGSGDPRDSRNYPGFVVVDAPQSGGSLNLDDSKDYFVRLGHPKWSSVSSGRSSLRIGGGRHVVIVGGAITFTQTNSSDDQICLMIDGGNSSGIVHVEGVNMRCVNGVTIRTPRVVQLENVRIWAHSSSTSTLHPDVIQVWRGHRSAGIRLHRFTAYSNFTYLSDLTDIATPYGVNAPVYWELHDIDLHPINGAGLNNWMGQPQSAVFRGSNLWLETSVDSAGSRRDLGDQLRQFGTQYSPQHAGYQIFDANNNLLYTQQPGIASGAPGDIGRIRGHRLRYLNTPSHPGLTGIEWRAQLASTADGADGNGNFVPSSLVGTGYVASGYR